jgi:hypothetical protein
MLPQTIDDVYFHPSDIFPYRPISPIWMCLYGLISFGFFSYLSRHMNNEDRAKNWLKYNTLLSFVHASICSLLLIIGVLRDSDIFKDPLSHSNHFNYALISFTIGYFLYDFFDCLANYQSSSSAILFHHVVVLAFFIHVLLGTRNLGYALYALSLEMNSVFLHARRLIRWYPSMASWKRSINVANLLTFVLFRFGTVFVGLQALYSQRHRLHHLVHLFIAIATSSIGILNVVLFYRLLKNSTRRHARND